MTFWSGHLAPPLKDRHGFRKAIVSYDWQADDPDYQDQDYNEPEGDTLGTMFITFSNASGTYEYPMVSYQEYQEYERSRTRPLL